MFNNKDSYTSHSNNETKDKLEAKCIISKYFIEYPHFKENMPYVLT